mmetsp:Transcript_6997/g.17350  ORF Transcript_6997/g.17350 Transcript_6997/m.17350 type:complete len:266 (-) Transcript_6997:691-1488(-)
MHAADTAVPSCIAFHVRRPFRSLAYWPGLISMEPRVDPSSSFSSLPCAEAPCDDVGLVTETELRLLLSLYERFIEGWLSTFANELRRLRGGGLPLSASLNNTPRTLSISILSVPERRMSSIASSIWAIPKPISEIERTIDSLWSGEDLDLLLARPLADLSLPSSPAVLPGTVGRDMTEMPSSSSSPSTSSMADMNSCASSWSECRRYISLLRCMSSLLNPIPCMDCFRSSTLSSESSVPDLSMTPWPFSWLSPCLSLESFPSLPH